MTHGGSPEKSRKSDQMDKNNKLRLKPSDCDLILKLILEKQEIQWYPELYGEKHPEVTKETAEYILIFTYSCFQGSLSNISPIKEILFMIWKSHIAQKILMNPKFL